MTLDDHVAVDRRLNAFEDDRQGRLLAQPRILALNNQAAAILSGTAQPVFTTIAVPIGGTTVLQQQLQYINVGVSLDILPRIAADGPVTTQIFSEVSTIVGYVQTAPSIAVRQELTSVVVGDVESLLGRRPSAGGRNQRPSSRSRPRQHTTDRSLLPQRSNDA